MNKYFETADNFISNKRIIDAYFTEAETSVNPIKKAYDFLISLLFSILTAITSAKAKKVVRLLSFAGCVIGFFGIVGAVEHGTLSMGFGLLIGLAFLGLEIVCLKKHSHED